MYFWQRLLAKLFIFFPFPRFSNWSSLSWSYSLNFCSKIIYSSRVQLHMSSFFKFKILSSPTEYFQTYEKILSGIECTSYIYSLTTKFQEIHRLTSQFFLRSLSHSLSWFYLHSWFPGLRNRCVYSFVVFSRSSLFWKERKNRKKNFITSHISTLEFRKPNFGFYLNTDPR